jgi:uncharacterized DUF497 family protein
MNFEWEAEKAKANLRKHGVSFALAKLVFDDTHAIEDIDHSMDYGEERLIRVGMAMSSLICVVFTERGLSTRIISARKATRHEREDYYRENESRW